MRNALLTPPLHVRRKVYTPTEIIVRYLARLQKDSKKNDGLFLYGHDAETSTEVVLPPRRCASRTMHPQPTVAFLMPTTSCCMLRNASTVPSTTML